MRRKFIAVERLEHIAREALIGGYGRVLEWREGGPRRKVQMRLDMDCAEPYWFELHGRDSAVHGRAIKPLTIEVSSRCRKCAPCKARRALMWRAKAFEEYSRSPRTYFGTLTTSPSFDLALDAEIQIAESARGVDFGRLTVPEQFNLRVKYGGQEVTRYLKRLRGDSKAARRLAFRYLLIAEAHASKQTAGAKVGRPHWHVLFHETIKGGPLVMPDEFATGKSGIRTDKYGNAYLADDAFLKRQWTAGHSRFQIAGSSQAATYVCKYLTKEANHRIRCSFRYGQPAEMPSLLPVAGIAGKLDLPQKEAKNEKGS